MFLSCLNAKQQNLYSSRYIEWVEETKLNLDFFKWMENLYFFARNKIFPNFTDESFINTLESTYRLYVHETGEKSLENHPSFTTLQIKNSNKEIYATPIKSEIGHGNFHLIIQQNNFTNITLHSLRNQTTRIEEILSKPKQEFCRGESSKALMIKPPPNLKQEKFLLSSKKDEDFMEGLIDRLQKINIKEKGSISVITKDEQLENSSSSSENEMQINKMHKVSIVKPFYKKATPIDLQIEEKKDYVQFNGEVITEWNIDGKSEYQIKLLLNKC